MVKKKKKETFKTFRNLEKSKFKTIKTTLKSVLLKHSEVQPVVTNLVFEINDLVIHSYQFIRLYILYCFHKNLEFPVFDDKFTFVKYCIKTLGTKSNSGRKSKDTQLLNALQEFYTKEYQPLLNHNKTSLVNKSHLINIIAEQIQYVSLIIFRSILFNIFYALSIKQLMVLQMIKKNYLDSNINCLC
jgi:hypothetical protein